MRNWHDYAEYGTVGGARTGRGNRRTRRPRRLRKRRPERYRQRRICPRRRLRTCRTPQSTPGSRGRRPAPQGPYTRGYRVYGGDVPRARGLRLLRPRHSGTRRAPLRRVRLPCTTRRRRRYVPAYQTRRDGSITDKNHIMRRGNSSLIPSGI